MTDHLVECIAYKDNKSSSSSRVQAVFFTVGHKEWSQRFLDGTYHHLGVSGGGLLIAHLPTSLVCSAWDRKSYLLPVIVLAVNSDGLGQEIVFFRRPGPADNFVCHDICRERRG